MFPSKNLIVFCLQQQDFGRGYPSTHLCMLISMQTFVVQRSDKIDNNK